MAWTEFREHIVNLNNRQEIAAIRHFLAEFSLDYDGRVDYTFVLFRDEKIAATGSLSGAVLRNIAVDKRLQGEGLTAAIVTNLMNEASKQGHYHYFLFTKPTTADLFIDLGFKEVARAEPFAVLLESGISSIDRYCRELTLAVEKLPKGPRAALVINANPFTLGHQALVTTAARKNASVVVLVVNEDRSLVPFEVRLKLVKAGLRGFNNVAVLPSGPYIISQATFPGYFTKGQDTIFAQTRLDATIFGKYIAPALRINSRYVGEEPLCPVTNAYNEALREVLPKFGLDVQVVPRVKYEEQIISASAVRELIAADRLDEIEKLVPATTVEYFKSPEALPIIERIQYEHPRHEVK